MFYYDKIQIKNEEERLQKSLEKSQAIWLRKAKLYKRKQREYITAYGVIKYNLNVYYKYENGKRKTFTIYHDAKLIELKRKKVDPQYMSSLVKQKHNQTLKYSKNDKKPSIQLVSHYAKLFQEHYSQKQLCTLKAMQTPKQNILTIHVDDSYLSVKHNKKLHKLRFRMFNIVLFQNQKPKQNIVLYEPYIFKQYRSYRTTALVKANIEKYTEQIYNQIKLHNIKYTKIRICSDGATWIKNLAKTNNWEHQLDDFHFKKQVNQLLGMSKRLHKQNRIAFKEYVDKYGINLFAQAKYHIEANDFLKLIDFIEELIQSKLITNERKLKELKAFKYFVIRNIESLMTTYQTENRIPTLTETHINHYFKKHFSKKNVYSSTNVLFSLTQLETDNLKYFEM